MAAAHVLCCFRRYSPISKASLIRAYALLSMRLSYGPNGAVEYMSCRPSRGRPMSILKSEVFEAFRALGVSEEKALKAAIALGKRDDDVASLKSECRWLYFRLASGLSSGQGARQHQRNLVFKR